MSELAKQQAVSFSFFDAGEEGVNSKSQNSKSKHQILLFQLLYRWKYLFCISIILDEYYFYSLLFY